MKWLVGKGELGDEVRFVVFWDDRLGCVVADHDHEKWRGMAWRG